MGKRFVDLIQWKKDGKQLSDREIKQMIMDYTQGRIPDYQMSAMLMAICFQGMSDEELTAMTMAMKDSGKTVDLSDIKGVTVDKHSTGGVGDKTTLVAGPIAAAAGVTIAKMSGRGLGFTGGTIDKLESIPGFRTDLTNEEFFRNIQKTGICITGQSGDLAPADKLLYALRDVTATVESIPLIAASVMSKKLAAGCDKILLEVTTGSGALVKTKEGSAELAKRMTAIGKLAGKETTAIITNMNEPLGYAVGNSLEVSEAAAALKGEGPDDVMELCYTLAGEMIYMAGGGKVSSAEARKTAEQKVNDGSALNKLKEMTAAQGGDVSYIDNTEQFGEAAFQGEVTAPQSGYIIRMNTSGIGAASGMLGAGRMTKESSIDFQAGIVLTKKTGDYVEKGERTAVLYANNKERMESAKAHMEKQYLIGGSKPEKEYLILDRILSGD